MQTQSPIDSGNLRSQISLSLHHDALTRKGLHTDLVFGHFDLPYGWTAFFVELAYPGGGEELFKLTTEIRVVPDTLPFSIDDR